MDEANLIVSVEKYGTLGFMNAMLALPGIFHSLYLITNFIHKISCE